MMYWIKRIARLLGMLSFFAVFFLGIDPADPFDATTAGIAFAKGCAGAFLFWLLGFIIADIVIKGLVTDVPTVDSDTIEGGLLQRLHGVQSSLSPGQSGANKGIGSGPAKNELTKATKA
jgi:hypothetical protein